MVGGLGFGAVGVGEAVAAAVGGVGVLEGGGDRLRAAAGGEGGLGGAA